MTPTPDTTGCLALAVCADDGHPIEALESGLPACERVTAGTHSGGRRRQFSLGRLAAHAAVARLRERIHSLSSFDISIESDARGAPTLPESCAMRVGIAHSGALAVGCAWSMTAASPQIGVDLERLRQTDVARSPYAFSRRERRVLGRARMSSSMAGILGWVAKEATWKALRLPPDVGPDAIELRVLDRDRAIVLPRRDHPALDRCQSASFAVHLQALSGPDGDYVMGLSLSGDVRHG